MEFGSDFGIIVQARLGSTRLPKKILNEFYNEESILSLLLNRLKTLPNVNIIIATTENILDDSIVDFAKENNYNYFRGSENDVLNRFIEASKYYNLKKICRVCSDNPFLDINSIDLLYKQLNQGFDYASFCTSNNIPVMKTHYGFWCEAVTLQALEKSYSLIQDKMYKEHVTNFIYMNEDIFKVKFNQIPLEIEKSSLRLTVDTINDFKLARKIYEKTLKLTSEINPINVINSIDKSDYILMSEEIKKNEK